MHIVKALDRWKTYCIERAPSAKYAHRESTRSMANVLHRACTNKLLIKQKSTFYCTAIQMHFRICILYGNSIFCPERISKYQSKGSHSIQLARGQQCFNLNFLHPCLLVSYQRLLESHLVVGLDEHWNTCLCRGKRNGVNF